MAGAELKQLEEKSSGARNKMNHSVRLSWYGNIVNGYPICNNDFATVEKFEVSLIASYENAPI
ncbi:hypothetical protein BYT27DRAFT_7201062 [Phlegmacium glaucopus]|nr:hypothetical protein BYT27DRAFT_7201387 [Phlegmacium glaucopus]KAF8799788.1 hypothetical protein BYT27DRAFT_7201062 [Phlegmacium glaucopus]